MATQSDNGTFKPLVSIDAMAGMISEVTGVPVGRVEERLRSERRNIGSSVRRAFDDAVKTKGARRHVYNGAMEGFYGSTDAFLYELAVWNLNSLKHEMGAWCGNWISRHLGPCKVLSIGDGMGFECLRFAEAGHDVTYFEVPGYCAEFARLLFERKGVDIEHLTDPEKIPAVGFDALVCLDVLEHIPDPPAFVKMLKGYLKPGGVLIVHAPFYMIHPDYPTHVVASRKFSGDLDFYRQAGFRAIDGRSFWNPVVLQAPGGDRLPASILGRAKLLIGKPYLMTGRKSSRPFRVIRRIKRKHQGWFGNDASIS